MASSSEWLVHSVSNPGVIDNTASCYHAVNIEHDAVLYEYIVGEPSSTSGIGEMIENNKPNNAIEANKLAFKKTENG